MTPIPAICELLKHASQVEFWQQLNPGLSVTEAAATRRVEFDPEQLSSTLHDLVYEGYFQLDPVLPEITLFRMAAGIEMLYQQGIPELFAFVYDEFWQINQSLATLIAHVLGQEYYQLPAFWAWYLDASYEHTGWGIHRDRCTPTLRPDGTPNIITVWIPLCDASPLNGCMYVLPANLDPNYPDSLQHQKILSFQDIRALPAAAGSVLGWNHALLHWGGRSSAKAPCPRISISCEFQRGDVAPYETPLLSPLEMPSFEQRLRMVGHQIQKYNHMFQHSEEWLVLADRLKNG